jgi:hypothetical protein
VEERGSSVAEWSATTTTRQMGTAGNMFFQTGGQYSTQATVLAVYARR